VCDLETSRIGAPYIYIYIYIYDISRLRVNNLWLYRWSVVVAALLVVLLPPCSKVKPEAVNSVVSS